MLQNVLLDCLPCRQTFGNMGRQVAYPKSGNHTASLAANPGASAAEKAFMREGAPVLPQTQTTGTHMAVRAVGRGLRQPGQPQRPRRHRAPAGAGAGLGWVVVGVLVGAHTQPSRSGPAHGPHGGHARQGRQGVHGVGGVTASMKS